MAAPSTLAMHARDDRSRTGFEAAAERKGMDVVLLTDQAASLTAIAAPGVAIRAPGGLVAHAIALGSHIRLASPSPAWFVGLDPEITGRSWQQLTLGEARELLSAAPTFVKLAAAKHPAVPAPLYRGALRLRPVRRVRGGPRRQRPERSRRQVAVDARPCDRRPDHRAARQLADLRRTNSIQRRPPFTRPRHDLAVPTTPAVSRRFVLKGAALGAAAAVAPIRWFDAEAAQAPAKQGVFGYGVASGDPTADRVIIWTRATPSPEATPGSGLGDPVSVRWEVASDRHFRHIVRQGTVQATAAHDHTVKVDVPALSTYTRYWYRFHAKGQVSQVGETRTAPDDPRRIHALRFALVSCSNYTGGYFGPYRAIADRDDLDFVLHVGDYIYEYGNGADRYGPKELIGKRDSQPPTETIDLAGYRLRHALHKADPDLAKAHRRHPFVTIFDDHEVANNTWDSGAENHTPGVEGDFFARRAQAYQAYMEWMPFRLPDQSTVAHQGTRFFRRFRFGALADLSVLETRQNRSRQIDVAPFTKTGGGFIPAGVPSVDAQLKDPTRHLPEPEQMRWLKNNVDQPSHWHLVGNQVVVTPVRLPGTVFGLPADTTLLNSDQWDGYQADQTELIEHLAGRPASAGDTVVLTGDIHSSWAMDLPADANGTSYTSAGVEFVCPSVTSDGFYEIFRNAAPAGTPPEAVVAGTETATKAVLATNPWIKYLDGIGHGFVVVDVTPDRVRGDWYHTPTPTAADPDPRVHRQIVPTYKTSWQTVAGSRRTTPAKGPIGRRHDEPYGS